MAGHRPLRSGPLEPLDPRWTHFLECRVDFGLYCPAFGATLRGLSGLLWRGPGSCPSDGHSDILEHPDLFDGDCPQFRPGEGLLASFHRGGINRLGGSGALGSRSSAVDQAGRICSSRGGPGLLPGPNPLASYPPPGRTSAHRLGGKPICLSHSPGVWIELFRDWGTAAYALMGRDDQRPLRLPPHRSGTSGLDSWIGAGQPGLGLYVPGYGPPGCLGCSQLSATCRYKKSGAKSAGFSVPGRVDLPQKGKSSSSPSNAFVLGAAGAWATGAPPPYVGPLLAGAAGASAF